MRQYKSLNSKEKMEYIGIMAIYPLILLYDYLGKYLKFLNTRKRQITASILTVCIMLTMIPVMAFSVSAATGSITNYATMDDKWNANGKSTKNLIETPTLPGYNEGEGEDEDKWVKNWNDVMIPAGWDSAGISGDEDSLQVFATKAIDETTDTFAIRPVHGGTLTGGDGCLGGAGKESVRRAGVSYTVKLDSKAKSLAKKGVLTTLAKAEFYRQEDQSYTFGITVEFYDANGNLLSAEGAVPSNSANATGTTVDTKGVFYHWMALSGEAKGYLSRWISNVKVPENTEYIRYWYADEGSGNARKAVKNIQAYLATPHNGHTNLTEYNGSKTSTTVKKDANIVLTGATTFSGDFTIGDGKTACTVNLCLNGHTLNMQSHQVLVKSGATLYLYDCQDTGVITGTSQGGTVVVNDGANLQFSSGNIKNTASANGSGINIKAGGSVKMLGGSIAGDIYGVENGGTFDFSGGTITGTSRGLNNKGTTKISGGTVTGSAGIYNYADYTLNLSGGTVTGTSTYAINNNGTAYIYGSPSISGKKADFYISNGIHAKNANGTTAYSGRALTANVGEPAVDKVVVNNVTDKNSTSFSVINEGYTLKQEGENLVLAEKPKHTHKDITGEFAEWTTTSGTVSTSGNYYLAKDITATGEITIHSSGTVTLCLNGNTLDLGSDDIYVNGTLNICDCSTGGTIKSTDKAIEISRRESAILNISGGTIIGSEYAVYNRGAFTMTGGTLKGTGEYGIGLGNCTAESSPTAIISGGSITSENNYAVYNDRGSLTLVNAPEILSATGYAEIFAYYGSISVKNSENVYSGSDLEMELEYIGNGDVGNVVVSGVTTGTNGNADKFTLTNEGYTLKLDGYNLVLAKKPDHAHEETEFEKWTATSGTIPAGNYYLTDDFTTTGVLTVASGTEVNLCLNGHTLDLKSYYITNKGSLKICDCTEGAKGTVTGIGNYSIYNDNGDSIFEISSGTVTGKNNSIINYYGIVTVSGGKIESTNDCGIYNRGTVIMSDGEVCGNGYGIYNTYVGYSYSKATVTGGKVCGNTGIYNSTNCTLEIGGDAEIIGGTKYGIENRGKLYLSDSPKISATNTNYTDIYFVNNCSIYAHKNGDTNDAFEGENALTLVISNNIHADDVIINNITDSNKNKFTLVNDDYKLTQSDDDLVLAYNDEIPPTGKISVDTNHWEEFLNKVTFGLFFNKYQYIEITANDEKSGVKSREYYLSETPVSLENIKKSDIEWKTYSSKVKIEPNNKYFVYAKITDNAGNVTYIDTDGVVLDNVAPTFSVTVGNDTFDDNIGRYYFITGEKVQSYAVEDELAGIDKVEYLDSAEEMSDEELENATGWQTLNKGDKLPYAKDTIYNRYYRAIDKAGNASYVYLGVVVCYADYKGEAFTTDYTYGSKSDVSVNIELDNMQAVTYRYISMFDKLTLTDGTNNYTTADGYEFYELSSKQGFGIKLTDGKILDSILEKDNTVTSITLNVKPLVTAGTDFYSDVPSTLPIKITIKPTDGEVKNISDIGKTYDGNAVSAPTFKKLGNGAATIEYKVKGADDSTYSTTVPINAGEYTVRVSVAAAQPYKAAAATKDFKIDKATFTTVVKQNGTLTYNGSQQTANVTTTPSGVKGNQEITYKYGLTENACNSSSIPTFKNADTYTVYFVASADNHNDAKGSFTVTIEKKELTVTAKNGSVNYGDAPRGFGVNYDGFVSSDTESILGGRLSYTFDYEQFDDVGYDYTITPKGLSSDNYKFKYVSGTLAVLELVVEIEWGTLSDSELIYDGNDKSLTATVKNKVGTDDITVILEYIGDRAQVTEEGFQAKVAGLSGGKRLNYLVPSNIKSPVYKITKADPIVTWPNDLVGNVGDKLSTVALESGFTWDNGDTTIVYGDNYYGMTYTPSNNNNYNILKKDIKVNGLDVTLPTGEITLKDNKWNEFLNNITFGLFFKETQSVTITASDTESGVKEIAYHLAAEELSKDGIKALESSKWTVYTDAFNIEPDSRYVVYARISDKAGNITYINSNGVVIDSIRPIISGIEDGKVFYGDATFTVDEDYLDTVTLDGEPIEIKDGKYSVPADNKEHTIVVTDKTGNQVTHKLTVYKNYKVSFVADGKEIVANEVGYGKDVTLPEIPQKDGYTAKWDVDGKNITADTTITAVYEKIPESPKTGDTSNIAIWVALMLISGLSVFGIGFAKKRKEQETE